MEKYVFKPYNPIFPELFKREEQRLTTHIGNRYPIMHVGSTAVPNLGGKGIIDILVVTPQDEMMATSELVQKNAGYDYKPSGSAEDRIFHQQDLPDELEGLRRYHLHITYPDSEQYRRHVAFIRYLIEHPDALEQYADLKRQAASVANEDRNTYNKIKQPLIDELIQKAFQEFQ